MRHHATLVFVLAATSLKAQAATNFTSLVNLFIGTASGANGGSGGNGFPGAAIPHAMVKVGIDVDTAPRQAGYISDNSSITGISLMHDEDLSREAAYLLIGRLVKSKRLEPFFSYGTDNYTAHACYDFNSPASQNNQSIVTSGTFQSNPSSSTSITILPSNNASLSFPFSSSPASTQAGALISFNSPVVLARFGVSFISPAQACSNAEEEVSDWDWNKVQGASASKWEDVLSRVMVDAPKEDPNVVELLYSSLYRASLVPANLTGENPYWESPYPFYDAFFCSWDVFRTVHPLLSITSPFEWAEIVSAYVDGWRHTGYIPECRANTKNGYVQGGSDGMPILGDFAQKYAKDAETLAVSMGDLYQALVDTATNTPPDWYRVGRQNTAWTMFNYIPTAWVDPSGATGLPTREASRTLEYAVNDFAVRQAAITLNKSVEDIYTFGNRSMGFVNVWDPNVTSDGFTGFAQRRFANGTFAFSPPDACSPIDPVGHSCARGTDNNVGFYESSSWEYSFFVPHSMATIIRLMGGNDTFIQRVDHYFFKGYFLAGNEPSFAIPWAYHYVSRPDLSALRVRNVTFTNFNTGIGGIPGNDDSGAMAALLAFHLLGLYPTPFSSQILVGSPMVSSYTIRNQLRGTRTKVTVEGFDRSSLVAKPRNGSRVFVKNITVNGHQNPSLCWLAFEDLIGGGEIVIQVDGDASAAAARGCGGNEPMSLEA
ncbi:hypothetical protein EIP91_010560 [Steccherinum ochraceum]|uniref:Glycoside hydrolase family 92 protein n=1 Tax=Steccherinum ochraceum TaxID=92696 RepID=A0A4R0RZ78_9APHY|nr:hypothetical protein EIP91_010560 [Steccherinum ochraceum]